jgi:hypothetical protein
MRRGSKGKGRASMGMLHLPLCAGGAVFHAKAFAWAFCCTC